MKTLKQTLNEAFGMTLNERWASADEAKLKKLVKPFKSVKVGDIAMGHPSAGGDWEHELGKVIWVGNAQKVINSRYSDLVYDFEIDPEDEDAAEQLSDYGDEYIVVDIVGFMGGDTLMQYNSDPSSAVVFKK